MNNQTAQFESFYQQHFDKVYRFVFFRVSGDKALAEDLVSDIFLKALKAFATFDEQKSQSAWIMTIAKNHLANHWRDSRPTLSLSTEGESDMLDETFAAPVDRWLFSEGQKQFERFMVGHELAEFLATLTTDEREIVTFHYLSGYSYADIAASRGSSEGAVKTMAHRALKKLRSVL